ncbi:hypothetical protein ABTY61_37315 [Kitasatospora sp. NPDC096128]|uniref:hypothetical protein n=1 Tax=Kitasatospora sp. NPDC096128 TaxID=3155547 RepID=UPI00331F697D
MTTNAEPGSLFQSTRLGPLVATYYRQRAGADLISFGRGFLANPDLVERLRAGAALNPVRDGPVYADGPEGYTDCPTLAGQHA